MKTVLETSNYLRDYGGKAEDMELQHEDSKPLKRKLTATPAVDIKVKELEYRCSSGSKGNGLKRY